MIIYGYQREELWCYRGRGKEETLSTVALYWFRSRPNALEIQNKEKLFLGKQSKPTVYKLSRCEVGGSEQK